MLASSRLTVDLERIRTNYRRIRTESTGAEVAAVVKADAYGLGAVGVSKALWDIGCRTYFVARLSEGIELRNELATAGIYVLDGAMEGTEDDLDHYELTPVLNSLGQVKRWCDVAARRQHTRYAALQIDTGMNRLGLSPDEADALSTQPELMNGLIVGLVMSHLASADEPASSQPYEQRLRFDSARKRFSPARASLANSSGIFLGPDYHYDLVRPGIALYGGNPLADHLQPNPMRQTVTLEAPIIQTREVHAGDTVGYGAVHTVSQPARLATVATGYADGFLRSGSGTGHAVVADTIVPVVGRISMDLTTIDVTSVAPESSSPGQAVKLICDQLPIDDVAASAGTIANEMLTALGQRHQRIYRFA